ANEAAKKLADLAQYLRENPSHLVWGSNPSWYRRLWRRTFGRVWRGDSEGQREDSRPSRSDRRYRSRERNDRMDRSEKKQAQPLEIGKKPRAEGRDRRERKRRKSADLTSPPEEEKASKEKDVEDKP
ncbi:unnamed protein product, partial [marine sediment metagenome]